MLRRNPGGPLLVDKDTMLHTFIRLTLFIALVLVAIVALAFVFKLVLVAAVLAVVAIGGLFLYNTIRGRGRMPVSRP
jgi:hypothetical protein